MHPAMQARIDGMNALRARATVATSAFYEMIDKPAPERTVRYQAFARGKDAYHVVEVADSTLTRTPIPRTSGQ